MSSNVLGYSWRWWMSRWWATDEAGYDLFYVIMGTKAEIVVVRISDRQVVSRKEAPRALGCGIDFSRFHEDSMSFLRKHAEQDSKTAATASKEGNSFAKRLPALTEYLTAGTWEDGTTRETSTLLVFWQDGIYKVCLNDRASEKTLWASGGSILDALDALEAMLATGQGEWRESASKGHRRPTRK